MKKEDKLYMYVTNDKYELPIAVAGSKSELARMLGKHKDVVCSSFSHGYNTYKVVDVKEDD